jgi:hypothetical protein
MQLRSCFFVRWTWLGFFALCLFLTDASTAVAQGSPKLTLRNAVVDWPDIQMYYSVRCGDDFQFGIASSQVTVTEDGISLPVLSHSCPDLTTPCPLSIAIVGDASGSMAGVGDTALKIGLHAQIDGFATTDEASLLYFNQAVTMAQGMTTDTALLHAAINSIPASGGTALYDGIYAGLQEIISNGTGGCRAVIAITDGSDNASSRTSAEIIDLATRQDVHVFTIAFGSGATNDLQDIAYRTGGLYKNVYYDSLATLSAVLANFTDFIREYFQECRLDVRMQCPDGKTHQLWVSIDDVCGETVTFARGFPVPLDTTAFADLHLRLTDTMVTGASSYLAQLLLDTPMNNERFEALEFDFQYNSSHLELKDIVATPGSLLDGATVDYVPTSSGVEVRIVDPMMISGSGPLLDFHFQTKIIPQDTICTPMIIANPRFDAGCFRPIGDEAEVCIRAGTPALTCSMSGPGQLTWLRASQTYIPQPFAVTMNVANDGDGGATGMRFRLLYDTTDIVPVFPQSDVYVPNPSVLVPDAETTMVWQLTARPRTQGDSITLRIVAEFDNASPVVCEHRVYVPAAQLTLNCAVDVPLITADADLLRYQPMPFPLTLTVHNLQKDTVHGVKARVLLPINLVLAGPDASGSITKDLTPPTLPPGTSGTQVWMVSHALSPIERQYLVGVSVQAANADSTLCQALVTVPEIDAPILAPHCSVPDALQFDEALDAYVPNPFTVQLSCTNTGKTAASGVTGTLVLPEGVVLENPLEPLTKVFSPSTIRPFQIGDPVPKLTWQVRYTRRAQAAVCPEFEFRVTGESFSAAPLDTTTVRCCVRIPPVKPQWACYLEIPDSLGRNASGTDVEPNPFRVNFTITNSGPEAGTIRRLRFPLPLQDGLSFHPQSMHGADDSVDVTIGPNSTANFEWRVQVQNRVARRNPMLTVTAYDDVGDPIGCSDNLPIAGVTQSLECTGITLDRPVLCGMGPEWFLVTATLHNPSSVNIDRPTALLEWTDVDGKQVIRLASGSPFGSNDNPSSRSVIFPRQSADFVWHFDRMENNLSDTSQYVHFRVVISAAGIHDQAGGDSCRATLEILPRLFAPLTVVGSLQPCEGDTVVLDAGADLMQYWWNTHDSLRFITVTESGAYSCVRSQATEPWCPVWSDTVRVEFQPLPPEPQITRRGDTLFTDATGALQWMEDGRDIPGATETHFLVMVDGSYSVRVSSVAGCTSTSAAFPVTLTGIAEPNPGRFALTLYPNPTRGVFTVEVSLQRPAALHVSVTDMLGRTVIRYDLAWEGKQLRQRIDLSAQPAGVYFIHVDNGEAHRSRLLLLQRE